MDEHKSRVARRVATLIVGSLLIPVGLIPAGLGRADAVVGNATATANPSFAAAAMNIEGDPSGNGTWSVAADGRVGIAGSAGGYGHATAENNGSYVMGIAATPSGNGYWIATHNGAVFSHGDAGFYGSAYGRSLRGHVVDIEATPTGRGYWLFTDQGQVIRFGDAESHGGPSALTKGAIVDVAVTPSGDGYWMVSSQGGVYDYGDARWYGTAYGKTGTTIAGIAATRTGKGYYIATAKGGVLAFGDAGWYGSLRNLCPGNPTVGIATSKAVSGYWLVVQSGRSFAFSPSASKAKCGPTGPAADLFDRLNDERRARGLAALRWDDTLASESKAWSVEMSRSGFRHSDLTRLFDGRFNLVGENIAWGRGSNVTAGTLHVAWMRSDGHRQNMLARSFETIGIGVYCAADGTMWATQEFGHFTTSGTPPTMTMPAANPIDRDDSGSVRC